jgi:hypothetical protein
MLKKIMVTSPILILFLFSISFLPLTQITEAEAQFPNKIPKQRSLSQAIKKPIEVNKAPNFNKIQKQRSLRDGKRARTPTPGMLKDNQKQKGLRKQTLKDHMGPWDFDSPMERLIQTIQTRKAREELAERLARGHRRNCISDPRQHHVDDHGGDACQLLNQVIKGHLGCDAPNVTVFTEPLCDDTVSYRRLAVLIDQEEFPDVPGHAEYVAHKQARFCGLELQGFAGAAQFERQTQTRQQSPLAIELRSLGKEFGKCFCKFGSRWGTHPSQGYENIVPIEYIGVCPL